MAKFDQSKKFRIFVVDDEEIISSTIETILRLQGFEATSFTGPLEALAASRSKAPDLLISDVVMPLLSGVDLAIQLQQCCPDCKVLLFSGQWATADLLEVARSKGYEFELIPKPVHPKDLLRKVQEITLRVPRVLCADEIRARKQLAENMRQAVARLKSDIATSEARKRPTKKSAVHASAKTA
jgi:DNA-binding NtrC family response regulator